MPDPEGKLVTPVAFDASDDPRSLEVDADDALRVALETAAKGLVGLHGYIGGVWQKNPLTMGFSDTVEEVISNDTHAAGAIAILSSVVPAGEVWVVTFIASNDIDTNPTTMLWGIRRGGVDHFIDTIAAPGVNVVKGVRGQFVLSEGDYVVCNIFGTAVNDRLRLYYAGWKFDIDL